MVRPRRVSADAEGSAWIVAVESAQSRRLNDVAGVDQQVTGIVDIHREPVGASRHWAGVVLADRGELRTVTGAFESLGVLTPRQPAAEMRAARVEGKHTDGDHVSNCDTRRPASFEHP